MKAALSVAAALMGLGALVHSAPEAVAQPAGRGVASAPFDVCEAIPLQLRPSRRGRLDECRAGELAEATFYLPDAIRVTRQGRYVRGEWDLQPDAVQTPPLFFRYVRDEALAQGGRLLNDNLASGAVTLQMPGQGGLWWVSVLRTSGLGSTELYRYAIEAVFEPGAALPAPAAAARVLRWRLVDVPMGVDTALRAQALDLAARQSRDQGWVAAGRPAGGASGESLTLDVERAQALGIEIEVQLPAGSVAAATLEPQAEGDVSARESPDGVRIIGGGCAEQLTRRESCPTLRGSVDPVRLTRYVLAARYVSIRADGRRVDGRFGTSVSGMLRLNDVNNGALLLAARVQTRSTPARDPNRVDGEHRFEVTEVTQIDAGAAPATAPARPPAPAGSATGPASPASGQRPPPPADTTGGSSGTPTRQSPPPPAQSTVDAACMSRNASTTATQLHSAVLGPPDPTALPQLLEFQRAWEAGEPSVQVAPLGLRSGGEVQRRLTGGQLLGLTVVYSAVPRAIMFGSTSREFFIGGGLGSATDQTAGVLLAGRPSTYVSNLVAPGDAELQAGHCRIWRGHVLVAGTTVPSSEQPAYLTLSIWAPGLRTTPADAIRRGAIGGRTEMVTERQWPVTSGNGLLTVSP